MTNIISINIEVCVHHIENEFKMMRSVMYWKNSNDLQKYCAYQNCQKQVLYKNLKTGGNDTSISCRMKYAQTVNIAVSGAGGMCTKTLDPNGNIVAKN